MKARRKSTPMEQALLDRNYNVVANSRSISKSAFNPSSSLALVDGDIGDSLTAERIAEVALSRFGRVDHLINNAGIYTAKSFLDYTADDLRGFISTNLNGFVFMTQVAV